MRFISAAILMMVFITLQFGKVTAYLYCKWEAGIERNAKDCGCDTHLVEMFKTEHKGNADMTAQPVILTEKVTEFPPEDFILPESLTASLTNRLPFYKALIDSSFPDEIFHPPAC